MRYKNLLLFILSFNLISCGTSKKIITNEIELRFLDDYIIPAELEIRGTKVGGLSGIDYQNGEYLLVADHPGNPRFYIADVIINQKNIDTVLFSEVVELEKSSEFLKDKTLDLESIRYLNNDQIILSSEGSIQNGKDPSIFIVNRQGEYQAHFTLPDYFMAGGDQKPRNNGVFEGLTKDYKGTGFWIGMELPLEQDGSKPKLFPTKSPIRITHFNSDGEADRQFVMQLEGITKIPWLYFAVNGLTELLEYAPDKFLVLERAFSAGHGTNGNTVRIFKVDAANATNTLEAQNLRKTEYKAAEKTLVFDFKKIKNQLKEQIIDNLEGMTFGPDLPNGNKTILLASDNNFNSLGRQISQIILLELIIKN